MSGVTTSTKVKIRFAETELIAAGQPTEITITAEPVTSSAATVISAATSDANHIVLTMNSALTGTAGDPQAFTVEGAASNPTLYNVAVSGKSVTLLLSAAIVNGEIITVSYAKTGSNDLTNGTLVANFTSQPVTNTVGPPTATPTITGMPKEGDTNVSGKAVPGAAVQVILSRYISGTIGGNFSVNADPATGVWAVDFKAWGVPTLVENDVIYVTATLLPNAVSDTLTVVVAPAPAPAVTSVTLAPAAATVDQGGTLQLTATLVVVSGADQTVNWTSSDTNGRVTVDASGLVTVGAAATAGDYTITATSTVDTSKSGTATITVVNIVPTASITTANSLSNDSEQFVLQFTKPLYIGGSPIADGTNITNDFIYNGSASSFTAVYNAGQSLLPNTVIFKFGVNWPTDAAHNGDTVTAKASTLIDAVGNAYIPVTYTLTNDVWQ